jgi:hypothetical protein
MAIVAVLAMNAPAEAGKKKRGGSDHAPDTKCVIEFASKFPKVLSSIVSCADPTSISVHYDVDAAKLKYAAKIYFSCKKSSKIDGYRCYKGRKYCVVVRCGRVYSCSESHGPPTES